MLKHSFTELHYMIGRAALVLCTFALLSACTANTSRWDEAHHAPFSSGNPYQFIGP